MINPSRNIVDELTKGTKLRYRQIKEAQLYATNLVEKESEEERTTNRKEEREKHNPV